MSHLVCAQASGDDIPLDKYCLIDLLLVNALPLMLYLNFSFSVLRLLVFDAENLCPFLFWASPLLLCCFWAAEISRNHCLEDPGCNIFWGMGCFSKALCDEQPDVPKCENCEQDLQLPWERGRLLHLQPGGRGRSELNSSCSGAKSTPQCEIPQKCKQQLAQPFPAHLFHSLVCSVSAKLSQCSGAARGLGVASPGTSWGSSCAGGRCCWSPSPSHSWGSLVTPIPRESRVPAACQAGIQVLGEAGGVSRAPERGLCLPARPAARLCSRWEESQLLEVTI